MNNRQEAWHSALEAAQIAALGIAPATVPQTWPFYRDTTTQGVPPYLEYLVRNAACRADFDMLMPGTRSIVCCAVRLTRPQPQCAMHFAAFCHIGDYPAIVRERLECVEPVLRSMFPAIQNTRVCVDTAPILERELSVRAGLGTVGYQRMVIHPEYGSWIALGELLVDVDLTPYRAELSYHAPCNGEPSNAIPGADCTCAPACRLCIAACPCGALSASGYDMHRCLAYWSTQHRGDVPEPFATAMGDVVWGCDRCQIACPRNARVQMPLAPSPVLAELSFGEILTSSARALVRRLTGTPIADARILQRNACIVIGNTRDSRYVAELEMVAETHPCDWVQRAAARALAMLGNRHSTGKAPHTSP